MVCGVMEQQIAKDLVGSGGDQMVEGAGLAVDAEVPEKLDAQTRHCPCSLSEGTM
jgi:hypothetical protein